MKITHLTTLKHKLQWLVLLVALLGVSQGVWAGDPYGKSWDVTFSGATSVTKSTNNADLGTLATSSSNALKISAWHSYWNKNGGNVCDSGEMWWNIDNGSYSCISKGGTNWSDDSNICHYKTSANTTIYNGTAVGQHTIHVNFNATGANWSGGGCGGSYYLPSSYGTSYSITFTVPGWSTTSSSKSFGSVNVGSNSSETVSLGTHYGASSTVTPSVSGTNSGDFEVTSVSATSVTVKFKPSAAGSRTATVTITDYYSKTYTLTVSGTGVAACTGPTVTTSSSSTPSYATATVSGTITNGTCTVKAAGICYALSTVTTTPTISNSTKTVSYTSGTEFSTSLSGLTPGKTYYYRAYATTDSETKYGTVRSFTTTACSAPTISTQPYNTATRRYCINTETPATLTVAATGGVGSYTYQWQQRNDGSDAFTDVTTGTGYQTASFTPSNATSGNRYYRCIVTNKDVCTSNSVTSNESCKYTINRLSASGTLSGDGTYCQGASGDTQTLTLTDYVGSRQWHKSTTSDFTPTNDTKISGATGTMYNAPINTTGTMYYKVVVTNGACPSETTDQATVTVAPNPEVYTVSGTATICSGESTNVTISNTETGFSYRLYKDGAATKEMFIGNGSSRSFSVTAAATYTIYAYNSSAPSCANNMSGSAIVSVDATSVGGSISGGSTSVCPGTTKNLTLGSYTGSIQWHSSSESGFTPSSTTAISGATSATYAAPISTAGTKYYKAVVKNGVCAAATSSQSYLTVKRSAVAGDYTLTNNAQTYNGSARAVTVTPDEGAGTPTVYYTGTGGTSYVKSTSAPINAGSYTITVDAANGDSYCAATDLNVGTLTISKANQNTLTISNTLLDFVYCDGANTTLTTTGGSGDGAVTYSVTSGSGDIEGSTLTATADGSISVTATKAASTNYNATTSAAKTFNFTVDAPTVYILSNVGGATTICGDPSTGAGSGTLRLANSQTGYNYQLYSNGSPVEGYAAKAGTTGSSIDFPVTSSGTYTVYAYYGTNSSNCATQMDGEITLTISTQPKLVRSAASVTEYIPVTITSVSTDIAEWKIVDGSGNDVSSSTAYLFDKTYDAITFKGASTDASTTKTYTIKATTAGGCSATTTVTVNPDTESCGS